MSEGIFAHWPNRITALRLLGSIALFVLFSVRGEDGIESWRPVSAFGLWLFVVTALSDVLDGWLARRGGHVTAFGRIADPFVDKILVLGSMIYLMVMPWSRDLFPAWIVVTVLAREILVTAIRGYVESTGGELPADWFGKIKMFAQCLAIGFALGMDGLGLPAARDGLELACRSFVWVTLLTSVGSGLSYVFKVRSTLT